MRKKNITDQDHKFVYKKTDVLVMAVAVLRIRIRMDPEFLHESGSGIVISDPDPAKNERADKKKLFLILGL